MPRSLFIGYTLGMAVICAIAVALAGQAYTRTRHADTWQRDARQWQDRATAIGVQDQRLVARYDAIKSMYDDLVARVQKSQTTLASEIAKTRAMRPRLVTGATIVSYVNGDPRQG